MQGIRPRDAARMIKIRYKTMKKIFYSLSFAALVFSGCSDDDNAGNGGDNGSDELRKVTVERSEISELPSSTSVAEVKFVVSYGDGREHDLLTTQWANGFSMTLPASVSSTYLTSISDYIDYADDYDSSDVSISHSSAMVTEATYFEAYDSDGYVGDFYVAEHKDYNEREWYVMYIYSDRDVTVKGSRESGNYHWKYDISLKSGWNRVAERTYVDDGKYKYEAKTSLPNSLHWYFSE